jgi:predicted PurR-regulated permease PerM
MKSNWSTPFRYVIGILFFVAFVAFLFTAGEAVNALVIAAFSAYLINPVVTFLLVRTKLSRAWAVNIVFFTALILLLGLPAGLAPIFFDEAQLVVEDLLDLTTEIDTVLSKPVLIGPYELNFEELGGTLTGMQRAVLSPLPEELLQILESTSIGVLWFLVIMVSVHLFLSHWPRMREWIFGLVAEEYQDEVRELYSRIRQVWMAYLRGQIVLMLIVGVVFSIAWYIIGIPGALALGVIAGFFTLVPDVGPFLAAILAVGVALLEGSSWIPLSNNWVAGITLITYLVLINLKGLLLRPYIMGRSVHMNEGFVFVAIISATILAGIMGALLVVPVLATIAIIGEYVRRRMLGLPAFGEEVQFVKQEENNKRFPIRGKNKTYKGE